MALSAKELEVGQTYTEVVVEDLTRTQIQMYAGASGDYNPLHTDEEFAKDIAGYPGVFSHGMLSMGLTGKMLTNWLGAGSLTKYGVRFRSQVWPHDTLTATATVEAIRETPEGNEVDVAIVTTNQDGVVVVQGNATARVN